jgi:hypothetical protein
MMIVLKINNFIENTDRMDITLSLNSQVQEPTNLMANLNGSFINLRKEVLEVSLKSDVWADCDRTKASFQIFR